MPDIPTPEELHRAIPHMPRGAFMETITGSTRTGYVSKPLVWFRHDDTCNCPECIFEDVEYET